MASLTLPQAFPVGVSFGVDVWIANSCSCDIDDADLTADGSVENLGIRLYPR